MIPPWTTTYYPLKTGIVDLQQIDGTGEVKGGGIARLFYCRVELSIGHLLSLLLQNAERRIHEDHSLG